MLISIKPKGHKDFASEVGQFNVISKKLQLWFSPVYAATADAPLVVKEFDMPEGVQKIELVDIGSNEALSVPIDVFKSALVEGKGYVFDYKEWKKKYLKPW